ncbi:MOSC domain-containing protein [Agromyces soli]
MQVTRVRLHPVKSFAGFDVPSARVLPWGLEGDRRWGVVDPEGAPVTAREENALLGLRAELTDGGLRLSVRDDLDGAPPGGTAARLVAAEASGPASRMPRAEASGTASLLVREPRGAEPIEVGHSRQGTALPAGDEADAWLSELIGRPLRLVWQPDPRARSVKPAIGGRPGESLSLADAGPLLLASEASLAAVNEFAASDAIERGEGVPDPLVVERFRPNVVVDGELPFAEEGWTAVELGGVRYRVLEVCDRCVMTTIDPTTLVRGKDPIRVLARHHRWDGKTWFGVRIVPELDDEASGAVLAVGDAATPVE